MLELFVFGVPAAGVLGCGLDEAHTVLGGGKSAGDIAANGLFRAAGEAGQSGEDVQGEEEEGGVHDDDGAVGIEIQHCELCGVIYAPVPMNTLRGDIHCLHGEYLQTGLTVAENVDISRNSC